MLAARESVLSKLHAARKAIFFNSARARMLPNARKDHSSPLLHKQEYFDLFLTSSLFTFKADSGLKSVERKPI